MHFKTMVEKNQGFVKDLHRIGNELNRFVKFYQASFPLSDILEDTRRDCEPFLQYPFYESLVRIWNHIRSEQRKDLTARNDVSIAQLKVTFSRNRSLLEQLGTNDEGDFPEIYGNRIFRCPKVLCFYFHEGFKSADVRDNHVHRHDRRFHCTVESCTLYGMGFASNSSLQQHLRTTHPEICDLSESFTSLRKKPIRSARYACRICNKPLSRRNIMIAHERTHRGEKPYRCPECGRAFTRNNDMIRHQKIHDR